MRQQRGLRRGAKPSVCEVCVRVWTVRWRRWRRRTHQHHLRRHARTGAGPCACTAPHAPTHRGGRSRRGHHGGHNRHGHHGGRSRHGHRDGRSRRGHHGGRCQRHAGKRQPVRTNNDTNTHGARHTRSTPTTYSSSRRRGYAKLANASSLRGRSKSASRGAEAATRANRLLAGSTGLTRPPLTSSSRLRSCDHGDSSNSSNSSSSRSSSTSTTVVSQTRGQQRRHRPRAASKHTHRVSQGGEASGGAGVTRGRGIVIVTVAVLQHTMHG